VRTSCSQSGRRRLVTLKWLLSAGVLLLGAGSLLLACEKKTPTAADEQPPTVRVTFPKANTSVSGVVVIRVEATDNESVERVEFYINEVLKATSREEPYEYSWETLILDNDSKHTIVAKAYDPSGNVGTSQAISVVVNNEINNPPTAVIVTPEDSTNFALGETIVFSGEGRDALGNALRDDQLSWFSDRDGYLGTGANLAREDLSTDWHTVTLVATDDRDLSSRDSVDIYVSTEAELIQVTFDAGNEEYPCWSPDGTRIAYSSDQTGADDIYIVSIAGGAPQRVTTHESWDWDPDWYGSELVFTSWRSGNADIWKISESGEDLVQLTDHPSWDRYPTWSPDGNYIAISSRMGAGLDHLWILSLEGEEPLELTDMVAYEADWYMGDIVFSSSDGNLYVTSVVGMSPVQITWDPAKDKEPSWSPQGDALAFTSDRTGNEDIWIWSLTDSRLIQLTFYSGRDYYPAWSPDGQWIAFSSDRNGSADIWLIQAP
jgi:dipeptidyl aminopeptidase/acylaminoacyl peptidase